MTFHWPPLAPAQTDPALSRYRKLLEVQTTVDEGNLYFWARPRIDALRNEFFQSKLPPQDFSIWLRQKYIESTYS